MAKGTPTCPTCGHPSKSEKLQLLRNSFVDDLAVSFAEGLVSLPERESNEITNAIRDLAVSSGALAEFIEDN
jgi:hypothetical protein